MQRLKNKYHLSILYTTIAAAMLLASCTASRFSRGGEKLYAGADIAINDSGNVVDKKIVRKTAQEAIRIKPNSSFLGLYPKLWFHTLAPDSMHKGLRVWLKKKLGEPPVLISEVNPATTAQDIDARLFNIGIFQGTTVYAISDNRYTAAIRYSCAVHPPFRIRKVSYPRGNDSLSASIAETAFSSLIKTGDPYDLSKFKSERERIDSVVKERGYFYFSPDYLHYIADTNPRSRTIDVHLMLKDDIPTEAYMTYRIGRIIIDPSYSLTADSSSAPAETTMVDSMLIIGESRIRPAVIARACSFKRNRLYSRRQHQRTLNRMMSLGTFKYAAIQYSEPSVPGSGILDVKILLTPMQEQSLRSELTLISKSNDFIGPKLDLKYVNRNILGGAEMLNLSLSGSAETQFVGPNKNLFSYEINPKIDLTVPRFMIPFFPATPRGAYVPKTKFSAGYSFVRRINFYDAQSLLFTYGFSWRQSVRTSHELNPLAINNLSLFNKSKQFVDSLNANKYLQKSYEEQFIGGNNYSYTYNEQGMTKQKNQFYFNGTAELAGNTISLVKKVLAHQTASGAHPLTVAGAPYSQFARIALDARNITNYSASQKLALRIYAGAGKAYGNSLALPYSRQFFCGGPSSVRAFQINSVGPGTTKQKTEAAFLESGGDLKLEANAEYRFPIIGFLKGATFIDAGNTWIWQRQSGVDTRAFDLNRFYKEFALGSGAGVRLDLSFFILRIDLGVPLRKPWLHHWTIGDVGYRDIVWNIAIGYPF
jgi:outer membrane protein insertion porin family